MKSKTKATARRAFAKAEADRAFAKALADHAFATIARNAARDTYKKSTKFYVECRTTQQDYDKALEDYLKTIDAYKAAEKSSAEAWDALVAARKADQ